MPSSLRQPSPRMELNQVQVRMAKSRMDVNVDEPETDTVADAQLLRLIGEAITRASLKGYVLAERAGVKPSQFSGALQGHGHFSVRWLDAFPAEFWNEFMPMLRAHKEPGRDQRKRILVEQFTKAFHSLIALVSEEVA